MTADPFGAIWKGSEAGIHSIFFSRARSPSNLMRKDCMVPPLIQMTLRARRHGATSILLMVLHLLYSMALRSCWALYWRLDSTSLGTMGNTASGKR